MPSITQALVLEHKIFSAAFRELQHALPRLRLSHVKRLTGHLEHLLLTHASAEDDLVLMVLNRESANKRRFERFHSEHLEITGQLTQLYSEKGMAQAGPLLSAVMAYSQRHFMHEDRVIFPLIEQVIESETLLKLGAVWQLQRQGALKVVLPEAMQRISQNLDVLMDLPLPRTIMRPAFSPVR